MAWVFLQVPTCNQTSWAIWRARNLPLHSHATLALGILNSLVGASIDSSLSDFGIGRHCLKKSWTCLLLHFSCLESQNDPFETKTKIVYYQVFLILHSWWKKTGSAREYLRYFWGNKIKFWFVNHCKKLYWEVRPLVFVFAIAFIFVLRVHLGKGI